MTGLPSPRWTLVRRVHLLEASVVTGLAALLAAYSTSGGVPPDSGVGDLPTSPLVAALLTVHDASALSGLEQRESPSGEGWPGGGPGALPDGAKAPLGAMCLARESILEEAEPRWQAYTVMFAQVQADAGAEFVATLTEHLFAGVPAEVEVAFDSLRDARNGCVLPHETENDGGFVTTSSSETFDAPPVRDDRFAMLSRVLALTPDGGCSRAPSSGWWCSGKGQHSPA